MKMTDRIFSPELLEKIHSLNTPLIKNIDRRLTELLAAGIYAHAKDHVIWIVGENENLGEKEEKLKQWLRFLGVDRNPVTAYIKPFADPYINNSSDFNTIRHKVNFASQLKQGKRLLVLTTLSALGIRLERKGDLSGFFMALKTGQEIPRDELTGRLISMGYRARGIVEEKGDIAWRGSIVDVFPIDANNPVRIEIEGEEVVSIRVFHPDTQKSIERIEYTTFPLARFFMDYKNNRDYCQEDVRRMVYLPYLLKKYRVIVSDIRKINNEFDKLMDNYEKLYHIALEKEAQPNLLYKPRHVFDFPLQKETFLSIDETYDDISGSSQWVRLKHSIIDFNQEDIGTVKDKIENRGYTLYGYSSEEKLLDNLEEYFGAFSHFPLDIPCSFENPTTRSLFLTRMDYRYMEKVQAIEEFNELKSDNLVKEIQEGDMVVHQEHGIGKFTGFTQLGFEGGTTEFLKIQYSSNEFLYVPVYQLDVLSKYVSFEGHSPRLDKMGGVSWRTKQNRARKSIVTYARELLLLYATRKAVSGSSYPRDPELEERLVQEFQYVETEDQKRAIREVSLDLEAEYPMDRLICGDVSFGKTEVALRATFRVVSNGKQVAVLCPTTILAYQHFNTFKKRFAHFPITVAMLSRLVSPSRRKKILKELKEGRVDVVIGTHSLIAKGVGFKRLGLYIIDEEQRFGVFQKEKLKKNREDIDALSLSATPIPRTLSLSMAGLQDISTIQTPPMGRIAIKNYVGLFSRDIIMSALLKEIERDGLVFIVYNNIEQIYTFQEQLRSWLPEVPTAVIHARMKTEVIEKSLMDFINKKHRVLISTTIIENGIDIPDVNTLIILGADRFGLTQLYQLRGRIGRGSRQAYAYFLVKSGQLTEKARMRLEAIREFADLGSGFKLAEFDLKLRGAGSLLGNKQHGHIEALGFDYYHKLLNKTVKELKGDIEKEKEIPIKINFSYSIEAEYIPDSAERIRVYRRIIESMEFEELDELRIELEDRYGRLPIGMERIFFAGGMRVMARKCRLEEVEVYTDKVYVRFPDTQFKFSLVNRSFLHHFRDFQLEIQDKRTCTVHFDDYDELLLAMKPICQVAREPE